MKSRLLSLMITVMLLGALLGTGGPFVAASATGSAEADGSYSTTGPLNGQYGVMAQTEGYVNQCCDAVYSMHDTAMLTATTERPGTVVALQADGTISGRVIDSGTSEGIANVHVNAHDYTTGQWVAGTDTDNAGYYTLVGVPTGSYRVQTHATESSLNYAGRFYDNTYCWHEARPVYVTAPENTPDINFSLRLGGTISGTVRDNSTGLPLANISVDCGRLHVCGGGGTTTDNTGNYTIIGVPFGQYLVSSPSGGRWAGGDADYARQLQDASISADAPHAVDVNFSLEIGGTISGRVVNSITSAGIANVHVNAHDYGTGHWMAGTNTDTDGYYRLLGMPSGSYRVQTHASGSGLNYIDEFYSGRYPWHEADPVHVTAPNDTPDVKFSLEVGGTISGTIKDQSTGLPLANVSVDCWRLGGYGGGSASTDHDGKYTIVGLPRGMYNVRSPAWGRWGSGDGDYVRQLRYASTTTGSSDAIGVDFNLAVGGSLSGRVIDSSTGLPVYYASIDAIMHSSLTGGHVHFSWSRTDDDGYYTARGLPSGHYGVRVHATGYITEWYSDAYSHYHAEAVEVTAPDDTGGIDFALQAPVPRETIDDAIDDGVAWLASRQNLDGSWGTYYQVSKTALALLILETHAADLGMSGDPAYIYQEQIDRGFTWLFTCTYIARLTSQPAGNPDSNGNGSGIFFVSPTFPPGRGSASTYETSIALMAIGAGTRPNRSVVSPGTRVDGWYFADVAQDVVDYLAWGQTDWGFGRGGWNYGPMNNQGNRSDQSNTGWVTLGLMYAEDAGRTIPGFVRSELDIWIDYIQDKSGGPDDGGSWYSDPSDGANLLRTGNLLQQMAFVGDTEDTPRVQAAVDYLVRHWWAYPHCYHTSYTVMKGLQQLGIETIDSIDWFQDVADAIMSEQSADGWWMPSHHDIGGGILSSTWALLTLRKEIPPTRMRPDLIVLEKHEEWVDEAQRTYRVDFTLKNRGNADAPTGHHVALIVNGVMVEEKTVPVVLAPSDTYSDSFDTIMPLSRPYDRITVCADIRDAVDELNEDNNCKTGTWLIFGIIHRTLPAQVIPGEEFEVTVTFTSPHDDFHGIELTDLAPAGWNVDVDTTWVMPSPLGASTPAPEQATYIWGGPYDADAQFIVVYKARVPTDADFGDYTFNGFLEYHVDPHPAPCLAKEVAGDNKVTVVAAKRCFIATAAYDTPMAPELQVLREFRDIRLMTNRAGQSMVDLYYTLSPPIAGLITRHPELKAIVRAGLLPAVAMSTIAVNHAPTEKMAVVSSLAFVSAALAAWATRRRNRGPQCC